MNTLIERPLHWLKEQLAPEYVVTGTGEVMSTERFYLCAHEGVDTGIVTYVLPKKDSYVVEQFLRTHGCVPTMDELYELGVDMSFFDEEKSSVAQWLSR